MESMLYIIIGVSVGIVGAMLGIGGGIIIVPLMTFLFGASPQEAVGTSMVVVMLNSISGAVGYLRKKMVFVKAAVVFSLATVPGSVLGGYVSEFLQGRVFYAIFGVFFSLVAVRMYLQAGRHNEISNGTAVPESCNWKLGTTMSVGVGFLASILGIGGGIIHVPMMTYILKFPHKTAVATSTFILAISAIAGASSHAFMGHVLWHPALGLGIGAMAGAQLGVRFISKTKSSLLLKATAVIVLITGIKFLWTVFTSTP